MSVTINVTKIFTSNPKMVTWINKMETSSSRKIETTNPITIYYVDLEAKLA